MPRNGRRASTPAEFAAAFWAQTDRANGCWLWTGSTSGRRYGAVWWRDRLWRTHRVAWELTHGPIPAGLWVLHHCDRGLCIRPDHLYLGDQHRNMQDMWNRDRHAPPTNAHAARLTADQVRAIRQEHARHGTPQTELARRYGVSQPNICAILNRDTWRHLE